MAANHINCPPQKDGICTTGTLKEELERLKGQKIIVPLGMDEISEWHSSFLLVPKANGKVRLCLDAAKLNKALIRPAHRGLTLNDILPR